jgi:glutathione S-transferase
MTIVLYTNPVSNFCAKVEIALRLKGLAYEALPPPGGYGSAAYKAIVPAGTIPALVDGDLVLSESETINEYLNDAWPEPPLLPADPKARARVRLVSRFHDTRLEPPLRALFPQVAPSGHDPAVVAARLAEHAARLAELAALVAPGPWLMGEAPSLADCAYPGTFLMAERMRRAFGHPHPLPPALAGWCAWIAAQPAVAPVLAAQAAATDAWLRGKGAL